MSIVDSYHNMSDACLSPLDDPSPSLNLLCLAQTPYRHQPQRFYLPPHKREKKPTIKLSLES
ncbi:hypothetical protein PISMIDRAFT_681813 [Pisolithus microcarpus 441]|uniref:Uncharacterized protein n=1 Tax=Pisolithus microcarpus 441 TaxID=765257 RepID=A0A0C9Y8K8_9AGAM|nr:hypothetical protein BKA83DRAFT_681813 [Pisolithus microcarpus]KIK20985.1 hypothetical protein PISMIDRAFT_681813 [Pisolithus microcarpus 441]